MSQQQQKFNTKIYPSITTIILKMFIFLISTIFISFEVYEEITCYQDPYFLSDKLKIAWMTFGIFGLILSAVSTIDSFLGLLQAIYKRCCRARQPREYQNEEELEFFLENGDRIPKGKLRHYNRQPNSCALGWNDATRSDLLGYLIFWFQDVPLLIIYNIGLWTSESIDLHIIRSQHLLFFIFAAVAMGWRMSLFLMRLFRRNCCVNGKEDVIYPPGTCAANCCLVSLCSMILNLFIWMVLIIITLLVLMYV